MCRDHQEHHHGHHDEKEIAGISVSHHDGAAIFNITKEFSISYEKMLPIMQQRLSRLSAWVDENGGFVGHIKGYVTDISRGAMLSTTGGPCSVRETEDPTVKLGLTCIVFMIDEEKMCREIAQIFASIK